MNLPHVSGEMCLFYPIEDILLVYWVESVFSRDKWEQDLGV